jgi:biotin-dependent carboxylase-like uncharacterized protein
MPTGEVRAIEPGLLTTIQDDIGRPGYGRFGVPRGGAMDPAAARIANRLVGNRGGEAVLEITLLGPTLEWTTGAHIGLAGGDLGATTNGLSLSPGHSYRLRPGASLAFTGVRTGARAYLAVEGGFAVEPILGSSSTNYRSAFGGFYGRSLRAGDIVRFAEAQAGPLRSLRRPSSDVEEPIHVVPLAAAAFGWFAPSAIRTFCEAAWTVAADADRNGIRLTGGAPVRALTAGIPSLPLPVGSVQVPPSGGPIVKMVDGPVTGGYPVLGVIPRLDHVRLAQAPPGATLRFRQISVAAARRLASTRDDDGRIELDEGDFAAGWAR